MNIIWIILPKKYDIRTGKLFRMRHNNALLEAAMKKKDQSREKLIVDLIKSFRYLKN